MTIRYGGGVEILPFWIATRHPDGYDAEYFGTSLGTREQRIRLFLLMSRRILIVPPEFIDRDADARSIVFGVIRRAGYADPRQAIAGRTTLDLLPVSMHDMDRLIDVSRHAARSLP